MPDKVLVTQSGLDDLLKELEERKTVLRTKIGDEIEHARQQGDLSENAAYKAAMEAKEFNENRISKLEEMIGNAEVTETKGKDIGIGKTVTLVNKANNSELVFQIVGQSEADPAQRKISPDSPIGAALQGKKEGDTVTVNLPAGEVVFAIKKVA